MANLLLINVLPKRVVIILIKLQSSIKELHNTASSVTFIKKALFVYIIPVYLQKLKDNFCMKKIVLNHLKTY